MDDAKFYYMEKDRAVKIPNKYKNMTYAEISVECARLAKTVKAKAKDVSKKIRLKQQ